MNEQRLTGRRLLDEVAAELQTHADVAVGRMFGSEGYSVRGKLFAFVATEGELVVKLPAERIQELALDNMVMRGNELREWASVPLDAGPERWRSICMEAHAFVDEITP